VDVTWHMGCGLGRFNPSNGTPLLLVKQPSVARSAINTLGSLGT
jgi:hypothetical protein